MMFQCIPVVGQDANGDPINMVVDNGGNTNTSAYIDTVGGASTATPSTSPQPSLGTAWSVTHVQSIGRSSSGLVALGYGSDNTGQMTNIAWVYNGSTWNIGPSGVGSVRSIGIAHDGTNYVVADSAAIKTSNFTFSSLPPAGGFASAPPTYTSTPAQADSVVKGSVVVGASLSYNGTWVGPSWTHEAGLPIQLKTGHYSTSYTFPGASGSDLQYQIVSATPNGNDPATSWNTGADTEQGYYGLIGGPTLKVEWPTA